MKYIGGDRLRRGLAEVRVACRGSITT